ncbi:MAG TPA: proline--tRNA ligase [Acidimicrobiales bacterium]|nr:proline--tRNA ligase [Acidimicrobiales bacterium]
MTPQSEDFSAWYNELVLRAELADRGPVRGTMIMRPYGYRIWELLQAELDARIKATGHDNVYFPLFIPEENLRKEAEHVEGFSPELAVVTIAGGEVLEQPLVVRPTSEAIIGESFSRWIESWRDLPVLVNQWCNVVRWELRPRLFLRTTEFLWQEGHTAHADEAEATKEMLLAAGFYREVTEQVAAMSPVVGDKTPGERFPGAERSVSLEAMMRDGRALQSGTSHHLGTNFAQAFDITYATADGRLQHCHTTSWGMSTRMVGGVIMTHGDDRGLILPPRLAPYQVVIVTLGAESDSGPVAEAAGSLRSELGAQGIRSRLDDRTHVRPGFKFNEWELRGVPLRVELGPRDLAGGSVTVAHRLSGEKEQLPIAGLAPAISERLEALQVDLLDRSRAFREGRTRRADSYAELVEGVATGFVLALDCGNPACEARLKDETTATPRCVPLDGTPEQGPCAICGEPSSYGTRVLFGRAY